MRSLALTGVLFICLTASLSAIAKQEGFQSPAAAEQWRKLAASSDFFEEMSLLESLGQDPHERPAVLRRLHRMWRTYDVLRRPEIAYLMCQLGDQSGVGPVAAAFFAGEYDTGRRLEPDGGGAGINATDDAFRMLVLYGTAQDHERLLAFLKLPKDPLRKRDGLCRTLLGLSSPDEGPGLPVGYPKERFPLDLAIGCLDFTEETETVITAPGGWVSHTGSDQPSITVYGATGLYALRGCDEAAQAIQNLTGRDFGHRVSDPVSQRDKAIESIKQWWVESHPEHRK